MARLYSRLNSNEIISKLMSAGPKRIHLCRWNILWKENSITTIQDAAESLQYEEEDASHLESDNILEKRNKSRLAPQHQNIVNGKPPYKEPVIPYHNTIKYRRRIFGTYGMSSGVDPGILWPSKDELQENVHYENVAYPDNFHVMVARAKLKHSKELETIKKREEEINSKAAKLEQWKHELQQKTKKKLIEAQAAKEKKERLLEEVRQHFGFKVDPRDERFKEMLEQKEKEESKRAKAEKKKIKQAKMMAKLTGTPPPPVTEMMEFPPPSSKVN